MAEPLYASPITVDEDALAAGVHAMRLDLAGKQVYRQQREVVGILGSNPRYSGILMPRRSTKTTSLFAWALGTCLTQPETAIAYTAATSGKAARDRFVKDVVPNIERAMPGGPFRVRRAAGQERIDFENGSLFQVLAPNGDEFRGQAFDKIVVDEAQEADEEKSDDLLTAILPTMDTHPSAQLVLAGTAGRMRSGNMLWEQLERGRDGDGGILEYAIPQDTSIDDVQTWAQVEPLLLASHPGIGTLTSVEVIKSNFDRIRDRSLFAAEYLGLWGSVGSTEGVIPAAWWNQCGLDVEALPAPPERFALAFAAGPGQSAAAIVAAWRDASDTAHILLIDHREGTRWLARRVAEIADRYKVPVTYDNFGVHLVEVEKMRRQRPIPRLNPLATRDASVAAAKLVEELKDGNVVHYMQGPLTDAALLARRRPLGPKGFAFGRPDYTSDIAAIEAAAFALHAFDQAPARSRVVVLRPTA